jgi:hypothetical protein
MLVIYTTPLCQVCGTSESLELDEEKLIRWHYGEHVQDVFPELTPAERELIVTGTHDTCWDLLFEGLY